MREKTDALISAALKSIEELEALISMIGIMNGGKSSISSDLREIAALLDNLPLLENDLRTIKKRLRGMLSSDPDKTPRAISLRDLPSAPDTVFAPVEPVPYRSHTRPGMGGPKK